MAEYGGPATGSGTQYFATDHLGSTRLVQDAQGNCAMRMGYAPYGAIVPRSGMVEGAGFALNGAHDSDMSY